MDSDNNNMLKYIDHRGLFPADQSVERCFLSVRVHGASVRAVRLSVFEFLNVHVYVFFIHLKLAIA